MELKYIVLMIIKILMSVPILVILSNEVHGAALMGGHLNNNNSTYLSNLTGNSYDVDFEDSQELTGNRTEKPIQLNATTEQNQNEERKNPDSASKEDDYYLTESEEIPNPAPLVLPGYNLPENIFNKGKPFYLEKDPLTGNVDFSKPGSSKLADEVYEYFEDEPNPDIFDKSNIDRKDGPISSHKQSDVNQLTPNFHDFLNLPVKYNPEKYVYPLISSSYANTKIQGNVNKYNHKETSHKSDSKGTTYKPDISPTYFATKTPYFKMEHKSTLKTTVLTTSTTTARPNTKSPDKIYSTSKQPNLMHSPINHPSYNEDFSRFATTKPKQEIYITTPSVNNVYLTAKPTTTTYRPLSLFEQLFGDYDDAKPTDKPVKLFENLPQIKNKIKNENEITQTEKTDPEKGQGHFENVLTGSAMSYEYEDYSSETVTDNIAVESKPTKFELKPTTHVYPEKSAEKPIYDDKLAANYKPDMNKIVPSFEKPTTIIPSSTNKPAIPFSSDYDYVFPVQENQTEKIPDITSAATEAAISRVTSLPLGDSFGSKVTSLPLGENHIVNHNLRPPLIAVSTHNLREKLNNEKVPNKSSDKNPLQSANIHIAPDQDTVSFVVGNKQNVDGSQYVGTSFKESPYDSNPFRPLITEQGQDGSKDSVSYTVQASPEFYRPSFGGQAFPDVRINSNPYQSHKPMSEQVGSSINIQPLQNSEASLSIGTPLNGGKVPGQVVDDKLEIENVEFGNKIVFPKDEKPSTYAPMQKPLIAPQQPHLPPQALPLPQPLPPPPQTMPPPPYPTKHGHPPYPSEHGHPPYPTEHGHSSYPPHHLPPNREILKLTSKPMLHQLPSDLTPPNEQDILPPPRLDRPRPPWDPRPGHFFNGRPEYSRPPRPQSGSDVYKRVDLPNILPQFRPNAKVSNGHFFFDHNGVPKNGYMRQPLLERPSNRPIGFYEKLVPPPPPPKNLHALRKGIPPLDHDLAFRQNNPEEPADSKKVLHDQFGFYQSQSPPKVVLANRRSSEQSSAIETLQMLQAKQTDKSEIVKPSTTSGFKTNLQGKDSTEKPIYVVYPVNSSPLKLDVLDNDKKEAVVVGTRAELPLPPSKINQEFKNQEFDYESKDRNDSPILKPHPRPSNFPIKSDFPYPLERPDPSLLNPTFADINSNNNLDIKDDKFMLNNQWNSVGEDTEARIVTGSKINYKNPNQISATLKTYTEKPIAVAYTPTEPYYKTENTEKYSMPNYASPVISEIRPGSGIVDKPNSEFTVSAVMHTHPQINIKPPQPIIKEHFENHKEPIESEETYTPTKLDFQAPFQASVSIDSLSQGWQVVKDNNKSDIARSDNDDETTTLAVPSTSEFDIENFKPQLFGGFKPLYNYPEDESGKSEEMEVTDRQER